MRLAALVAYDGTCFKGFQRQAPERGPNGAGTLGSGAGPADRRGDHPWRARAAPIVVCMPAGR